MGDERDVYLQLEERAVIRTKDIHQTEKEIGAQGYSDKLINTVITLVNSGKPEGYNACSMVGRSKRGAVAVRLFAIIDEDTSIILRAGFKVHGCLGMIASASTACTLIEGKTIQEALQITAEDIRDALDGMPSERIFTLYFAEEAIRALLGDYYIRKGAQLKQLDSHVACKSDSMGCLLAEHCSLRDSRVELRLEDFVSAASE